jgi:hypothetical protein
MDKSFAVIKNSLEHYDENYKKLKLDKTYNMIKYIMFKKINKQNIICLYDRKKKLIFEYEYGCYCVYITKKNILKWAWSCVELDKYNNVSKQLLTYMINNNSNDLILKNELINSSVNIVDKLQIQLLLSVISYLTKIPMIFNFISNKINEFDNLDEFINYDYENINGNNENDNKYEYNFYLFLVPIL